MSTGGPSQLLFLLDRIHSQAKWKSSVNTVFTVFVEGEMLLLQVANLFSHTAQEKCQNLPNADNKIKTNKNPVLLKHVPSGHTLKTVCLGDSTPINPSPNAQASRNQMYF